MTHSYTRRGFLRTAGGAVGLGTLSGCLGTFDSEGARPVRFGAILPLSGPLEQVGTHGKRAVEQAVTDVNRAGGILGRSVELTAIDSEANPDTALDGYRSLAESGAVGFVGGLVSDVSLALAPEAAEDGLMEVSPASTNPQLTEAGRTDDRKFFGRTVPSDILQAVAMAKILDSLQYAGAETVSLLAVDNAFGSDLAAEIDANLDADVLANVGYDPSADSFGDTIDAVFADSPDAVGFVSVPGQEHGILDAYAASDYHAPWVFSAGMFGTDVPSSYEGFYSASLSSVQTEGYFGLSRRLSDIAPLAPYAANAYDAMFLMAAAAEKAGTVSGPAIADSIRSVSGGAGHTVGVGEFERVRSLVDAGRGLNYQGAASGVDLTDALEPLSSYVVEHVSNGRVEQLELLQRQFFQNGGDR